MTPRQRLVAALLELMPDYGSLLRLDLWESHVAAVVHDGAPWPATPCEQTLDAIYELGRFNLYGQFDTHGTAAELQKVRAEPARLPIDVPALGPVSDW